MHNTIWRMDNELRGSTDGCDSKSYVIGLYFCQFASENLTTILM